ncbi:MAG TPA: helix-turn-helix domain-containing protein [Stackebrandtia sp.]|uniref:TetR/AcrR family transcriptional regulator n=1 Tax=Stackebrandtia sp. TaxID=2023065 RepID=UPI002D29C5C9|nr:helix-turn-helix domain-containing protein [Stackebrandtia sp.]HZE41007.1 helix-turn-helix domain-containing protein [Stackebrandtia sp.]
MKPVNAIDENTILDAAYDLLLSVGMQRMTMADLARHAGISRATLYRRWGSVREVVAALTTREWTALVSSAPLVDPGESTRRQLVDTVVAMVRDIRVHPLMRKIIDVDPEFLLPYLLRRRGANTDQQLDLLESGVKAGMADGSIRQSDTGTMAKAVLLTAWSFTLTGPVLVEATHGTGPRLDALDAELRDLLDRYLAP